ncbi:unnamed protein product [Chironomus riparius]|uniref:Cytochrome P450 n=1 Tax=Chironomus riparius TaxID=315576 RepID=A0A9N9WTV1_9DIPT|nr:unnamed protein product [Chironomus riparius]
MYETDLLMCIAFILLFMYISDAVRDYMRYRRQFWNIRGPKTLPLTIIAYIFTARSNADRFEVLQNLSKRYPRYYSVWFGTKYLFVTDDPHVSQKLLTIPNCVEKNFFMDFFGFPRGLIAMKSDRWKYERKLLNSSFSLPVLQSYVPIFTKCIAKSIEHLKANCDKEEFDIKHDVTVVVMNAVMNTTFGKDISRDVAKIFMENTEKYLDNIWNRAMKPHYHYDIIYNLSSMKRDQDKNRKFFFDFITNEWDQIQSGNCNAADVENSFIGQLLKVSKNGRNYEIEDILDHCGTMMVAAADTMSTALNFIVLMLAMHENVQECIIKEINEVLGDECMKEDLIIDYEKLSALKYVEMTIKEALRLFTPATGLFRETKADVDLGIENIQLPKGTNLVINIYGLHRKKEIWGDDAHLFKPERFDFESSYDRSPFTFLPFSSGIRMCVGNRYAMIFMKLIVLHYVKNFHFSTSLKYEEMRVKAGITLNLIGNHSVKITRRRKERV